jgi:hypothetical protein
MTATSPFDFTGYCWIRGEHTPPVLAIWRITCTRRTGAPRPDHTDDYSACEEHSIETLAFLNDTEATIIEFYKL